MTNSIDARESDLKIAKVEAVRLRLPFKSAVSYKSVKQAVGEYVLVRLTLGGGLQGVAETNCRQEQSGEDAVSLAYQVEAFFGPRLIGRDPLGHLSILHDINACKACPAAKSLIDIALWDLRGKVLGQPVWRLLGGEKAKPMPLTWIAHGNSVEGQIAEARKMRETRGYRGLKLKTWRRSREDLRMIEGVRKAVGDDVFLTIDCNGTYAESEARAILSRAVDFDVRFIEEPCDFKDIARQADMAMALPIPMLGDQCCETLADVNAHLRARSIGGVSVKMRRTGVTQSLKIISLCEAANVPALIGTDSESRLAAMPRAHLHAAIPHLADLPAETHFYDKLDDDVFMGDFKFADGALTPSDAPGFGAEIDEDKLRKYAF